MPAVRVVSLMAIGRPCNGPRSSPRITAASACVRGVACVIGRERHDGIELRVDALDHLEMRVEQLDAD